MRGFRSNKFLRMTRRQKSAHRPPAPLIAYALVFTGTQYIDTNIPLLLHPTDNKIRLEMDCAYTRITGQEQITGVLRNSSAYQWRFMFSLYNGNFTTGLGTNSTSNSASFIQKADSNRNIIFLEYDKQNAQYIRGIGNYALPPVNMTPPTQDIRSPFVGHCNAGGTSQNYWGSYRLYGFKIYKNDALAFNGIPVPKGNTQYLAEPAPSNCLFDTVSRTYFENLGSGTLEIMEDL